MSDVHLSVVAGSRNDDHGGNLLSRMQYFVVGFIEQCKRHQLNAELILVDWNPPTEKAPLSRALEFPEDKGPCKVRIITVPQKLHNTFAYSKQLPMYQMIAKNVGIRRAKGKYILATNIDILFPDALIKYLRDELLPGYFYRTNRLDVPQQLPGINCLDTLLESCKNQYFRINERSGTKVRLGNRWVIANRNSSKKKFATKYHRYFSEIFLSRNPFTHFLRKVKYRFLHHVFANACGDFTLLTSEDWKSLQGYSEYDGFSWHLDSLLLHQAHIAGIKEKELSFEKSIYHIEHQQGSGYTPENHDLVFKKIKDRKIPCLDDDEFLKKVSEIRRKGNASKKQKNWGLIDHDLPEVNL